MPNISKKELNKFLKLFCKCDYLKNNPKVNSIYVENHLGVNHGWICPKCLKFIQIG